MIRENLIKKQNGCWNISIDGQFIPAMAFTPLSEEIPTDYLRQLGEAEIKLFFLVCDLPWLEQKGLDINGLNYRLEQLQLAVPGAKVILRVNLHPPLWWMQENPDELVYLKNNKLLRTDFLSCYYRYEDIPVYSLVSKKWRHDAGNELKKLISLVSKMPAGNSVIGYFMAAGATGEWLQRGVEQDIDYGKAFKQHFSEWLKAKYDNKENLRKSWKREYIDFDNITIPSLEEKSGHFNSGRYNSNIFEEKNCDEKYNIGGFINPDKSCAGIDFLLALYQGIAESIEYFCRVTKDASKNQLLTGAFHGTLLQSGTRKILLNSDKIDFLATPGIYINRKPGEITDIRCMSDSYALNKKIFIMEDDTRTHLASPVMRNKYKVFDVNDSITQMKRDFGRNLCRNLYGWWFDMYIPPKLSAMSAKSQTSLADGGSWWYDSKEILELIRKQQKIAKLSLKRDRRRNSSIAVIMDEDSTILGTHLYYEKASLWRSCELARLGAPLDYYYHEDLDNPEMPDYKLYIFLNIFMLNSEQKKYIKRKLKKTNATALWMYASGVYDPSSQEQFSHKNIEDLTEIKISYDPQIVETAFKITIPEHKIIRGSNLNPNRKQGRINRNILFNQIDKFFKSGEPSYQMPNFYPQDKNADILGNFLTNNAPALAYRNLETWKSIYCAAPFINTDLLRAIAENAGCHIICNSDDFIFMNNSYLTIHAASSGNKQLSLEKACSPRELYSEKSFGKDISAFTVDMQKGETLTFCL